jgi:DNA recombination protein RmuC
MPYVVAFVVGLLAGGVVAWVLRSARAQAEGARRSAEAEARAGSAEGTVVELRAILEQQTADINALRAELDGVRQEKTKAETRIDEALRNVAEQKELLDDARNRLSETFKALSADALQSNNQAFLDAAKRSLDAIVADAKGDLGKRREAIEGLVKPLSDSLTRYHSMLREVEGKREKAYGSLQEQLQSLARVHQQLQKETGDLVTALRTPQVRGRWGEMTLHRVVELAGMSEHCDFTEQVSVTSESGRLRPDMVIHLPGNRQIVVDSKVSLDAYLTAISADSEEARQRQLGRHAAQTRTHMEQLASKAYWDQFQQTPDMVVMFIPGESFFGTALEHDRSLLEDGMSKRVVLATPTTLIALLRAVAYGWRQEQIARNAQAISDLGKELYDRLRTLAEHFVNMGKGLDRANRSFNSAVGSLESRIFPSARRFKDLGISSKSDIPEVAPLEATPRMLNAPELSPDQEEDPKAEDA